jgi:hypothetical protein
VEVGKLVMQAAAKSNLKKVILLCWLVDLAVFFSPLLFLHLDLATHAILLALSTGDPRVGWQVPHDRAGMLRAPSSPQIESTHAGNEQNHKQQQPLCFVVD